MKTLEILKEEAAKFGRTMFPGYEFSFKMVEGDPVLIVSGVDIKDAPVINSALFDLCWELSQGTGYTLVPLIKTETSCKKDSPAKLYPINIVVPDESLALAA